MDGYSNDDEITYGDVMAVAKLAGLAENRARIVWRRGGFEESYTVMDLAVGEDRPASVSTKVRELCVLMADESGVVKSYEALDVARRIDSGEWTPQYV